MARSVLVTGGSGYFGTVLAELALARGDAVRIFDLNPTDARGRRVRRGRRARPCCAVRAACEGVDVVFHNVAQVPLAKDRALFDEVNVGGTANVLVARPRCRRREGRAHVVERGVRDPRAQSRDRRHAVPAARGVRTGQAAGRAPVPRRDRGRARRHDRPAPHGPRSRPPRRHGAPVRVRRRRRAGVRARRRRQPLPARARERPGRRVLAGRRSRRSRGVQRRRASSSARCARRCKRSSTMRRTGSRAAVAARRARALRDAVARVAEPGAVRARTTGCSTASRCTST